MPELTTVAAIAASLRERGPLEHELTLAFDRFKVRVRGNHPAIKEHLLDYFQEFLAEEGAEPSLTIEVFQGDVPDVAGDFQVVPGKDSPRGPKEAAQELADGRVVKKLRTGMMLAFGPGLHVAVGPALDNLNQVVNFVNNRHIQWMLDQGAVLGHAAAICSGGRAISIAGLSGMGKSTLSLHLMSAGVTFISNDRVVFGRDGDGCVAYGVAKHPRINPGTILANPDLSEIMTNEERGRFSAMAEDELWELEYKYDAVIHRCFGADRFVLRGDLSALVLLDWRRDGGKFEVLEMDAAEADRRGLLDRLIKPPGIFYLADAEKRAKLIAPQSYIDTLKDVPVMIFTGGVDFEMGRDRCLQHLREGLGKSGA